MKKPIQQEKKAQKAEIPMSNLKIGHIYLLKNERNSNQQIIFKLGLPRDKIIHNIIIYSNKYNGKTDAHYPLRKEIEFYFLSSDVFYELSEKEAIAWLI